MVTGSYNKSDYGVTDTAKLPAGINVDPQVKRLYPHVKACSETCYQR
ncbi:Uncharacterised protein [Nocardia otitidiscaviarum]|uniref:Uncharacterized protein n=1 Tax=Nocardia otitidiscaviarum TaxID=1823 RepID=A0A378YLY4_9NOCA|nr:Uncharacterised protein [Nocardia otitidiscaviarum]